MQSQFFAAINQICDEKNISKERVLETIEAALKAAYRKDFGNKDQEIDVKLDPNSGNATIYQVYLVVDKVEDENLEMSEKEAHKYDKKAKLGDEVKIDVTPSNFGRIAAQAAKQVIIQRIQEAERDVMYDVFKDRENELLNAIVHRVDGRNVYVNLDDKTTTNLPFHQQIKGEKYYAGQRIKLYLDKVTKTSKGPELLISRTHKNLVKKLLELEIPEIKSGLVEVKSIARDPGVRSKVAVFSSDEKIDPIGSCVGQKGVRVKNIMDELGGERIDIIEWSENMVEYIKTALAPAKTSVIQLFEEEKRAKVFVQGEQRPLAIGKNGQNVRLASLLTGWEIDILDISEYQGGENAVETVEKIDVDKIAELPLSEEVIEALTASNLTMVAQLKGLSAKDIAEIDGISDSDAEKIAGLIKMTK